MKKKRSVFCGLLNLCAKFRFFSLLVVLFITHATLAQQSIPNPPTNVELVDLGLPSGTQWANMNVGASQPEESGNYYAWGETTPKGTYSWATYKWCEGSSTTLNKYCSDEAFGSVDSYQQLTNEDDAAYVNWGAEWSMPTSAQLTELLTCCTAEPFTLNGVDGFQMIGTNGKSIFLPKTRYMTGSKLGGKSDDYWTKDVSSGDHAYSLNVYETPTVQQFWRFYGFTIRPVSTILIDRVSLSSSELSLLVGKTTQLTAISNVEDDVVIWESSNPNIATVEDGLVKAKNVGNVIVTVKSSKNSIISATCNITIIKPVLKGDINEDGKVDILDVTELVNLILK